jgi:hypothetical protein
VRTVCCDYFMVHDSVSDFIVSNTVFGNVHSYVQEPKDASDPVLSDAPSLVPSDQPSIHPSIPPSSVESVGLFIEKSIEVKKSVRSSFPAHSTTVLAPSQLNTYLSSSIANRSR